MSHEVVKETLLILLEHLFDLLLELPRCFAGTLLLPLCLFFETDPQILERWCCADEVHLGKHIRAKDFWSRILV